MRVAVFILAGLLFNSFLSSAQVKSFPQSWEGNWKGQLNWFQTGKKDPQKINMELRILKGDSSGIWGWQIIYGSEAEDNRPYKLMRKDTTGTHWVIDEMNGIALDQYWVGNRFCGAFTVGKSTIINSYWIEKGKMVVEFYSISAKPVTTTGNGTEDSPSVDSYKVGSYQKAILTKVR